MIQTISVLSGTICVGKRDIGWQSHFGVVRSLENQVFYRGE